MSEEASISVVPLRTAAVENRPKAASLIIVAISLLAIMDVLIKYSSTNLSTTQIVWGRYVAQSLAILLIIGPPSILACIRTTALGLHLTRALVLFIANFAFMAALRYMPLTEANVVAFASPLLLTALSYPVLREKVGLNRWLAVIAGFIGVLVVMRPGTALFQWASLLPLLMAICAAIYHVMTRLVERIENPAVSIYFLSVIGAVSMSAVVPWFWTPPDALGWTLLFVIGVLGTVGHLLIVRAFAYAPASVLAPFFYVHLIWALIFGWFVFGDLPTLVTIVGGALITMSGIYVYRTR